MVKTGELRHRIDLQRSQTVQQLSGESNPVYTTIASLWAKVSPVTGKELELSQIKSIGPTTTHHVTIRWYAGIDPKSMRISFTDTTNAVRIFSIDNVLNLDESNTWMTLECTEYKK